VASTVAAIMGIMSWYPPLVSSRIRARPVSGACIAAPSIAAAQTSAYAPDGEPGQAADQAIPAAAPSTAPVDSVGVNSPPDAPLPRHAAVASGFSTNSVSRIANPPVPANASAAMSRPLPNNCGSPNPITPSSPIVTTWAATAFSPVS
jgi:hypothetical protein